MRTTILRRARQVTMLATIAVLCSFMPMLDVRTAVAAQEAANPIGIVCTTDASPNPTFNLTTKTGIIALPDGNTMFMWGFSEGNHDFQHPGPVLCVTEGDTVTITLHNTLGEDVSIIFPGQDNVLANGASAQPQFDAGGNLTSLTNVAPANGGSITYQFVAGAPGTYLYESGTEPEKQIDMGLFGALIVRPLDHPNWAYNRPDSEFDPATEFMVLLSEIDPYLHQAVEAGQPFNLNNRHPRYWLINGRGFPDSIADNFASWVAAQPYGALARIHPVPVGSGLEPALSRYLNVGTMNYPFHPHGNNGRVIGRDGSPLAGSAGEDLSFEKFDINIGPGQTWDVLFSWYDAENYNPTTNPVPAVIPNLANLALGMFYSGSPYLGSTGTLPPGASTLNQCGEYYIISHNHALPQLDSWGALMTGPITYLRIDPPMPNTCQQ